MTRRRTVSLPASRPSRLRARLLVAALPLCASPLGTPLDCPETGHAVHRLSRPVTDLGSAEGRKTSAGLRNDFTGRKLYSAGLRNDSTGRKLSSADLRKRREAGKLGRDCLRKHSAAPQLVSAESAESFRGPAGSFWRPAKSFPPAAKRFFPPARRGGAGARAFFRVARLNG